MLQLTFIWDFFYGLVLILIRGAFAAFFLRAIPQHEYKLERRIMIGTFAVYGLFTFANCFLNLFQCGDVGKITSPYSPCLDANMLNSMGLACTAFNVAIDWIMTLVPVVVIWKSTMTMRTKISALLIVMLGAASSIISVIRIPTNSLGAYFGPEQLGDFLIYLDLAMAENWVAILAISLAAMKPLVRKYLDGNSERRASRSNQRNMDSQVHTFATIVRHADAANKRGDTIDRDEDITKGSDLGPLVFELREKG